MFLQDIKIFVDVVTLSPLNVKSKASDWRGDRFFRQMWDAYAAQRERKCKLTLNQSYEGSFDEDGKLGLIVKVS